VAEAEITGLLDAWRAGDAGAAARLAPRVYDSLRQIAGRHLRNAGVAPATMQPTALAHEAWLKLADGDRQFTDRRHFFAVAALTIRGILVDYVRSQNRDKRGGQMQRVGLTTAEGDAVAENADLLRLDDALGKLAQQDRRTAEVIELHYFGGLERDDISSLLSVSIRTVDRALSLGRAWLARELAPC
jgi:RNA polymerase sigma factor (TIGR02999 family)